MQRFFHSRWLALVSALASGAGLVLAFAPFHVWPMALVSPALLAYLWTHASPRVAARIGFVFGIGFFGFGVSWVYYSIHEFGQAPFLFAAALTVALVLIMALYPALLGWLQALPALRRHGLLRLLVVIPAGWVLLEWLRGWLFTGFPWLQLGYSQTLAENSTPFAAMAPIAGVLGISYALVLFSMLILTAFLYHKKIRYLSALAAVLLLAGLLVLQRVSWWAPIGKPIDVALVQGNIAQENKWEPGWLVPTVERYERLTMEHKHADLIIWPEAALPGTLDLFDQLVLQPLREELNQHGAELLTGLLYTGSDQRTYNALVKVGQPHEIYLKRHLVPFGEYMPFRQWFTWLDRFVLVATDDLYPGDKPIPLHAAGQVIGSSICYEDAFGEEMADFLPQATLLVNVSNDAWFGPTIAPEQHLQIAQMRSLELARPLLRATNTGVTAIIDANGHIASRAPQFKMTVLTGEVSGASGYTYFARWRNLPLISLLAVSLFIVLSVAGRLKAYHGNHPEEAS